MKKNNYILGISSFFHDSSACLIKNGKVIAAVQEERFTRLKFDSSFPINSIKYCLDLENITINEIDTLAYFENNHLKFDRIVRSYIKYFPLSIKMLFYSISIWLKNKLFLEYKIKKFLNYKNNLVFFNHHFSHAGSAFYPSPFLNAAILIVDAVGEWDCTSLGIGNFNKIKILKNIEYPNSLGMLYSAFTEFSGFRVNSDEYKLMGLAPYGKPIYKDKILKNIINIKSDGSYKLNLKYFNFHKGTSTISRKFEKLFKSKKRKIYEDIREIDADMASSIQYVINEIFIKIAKHLKKITNSKNLVLAGGVCLNCVSIGKISELKIFKKIWVQPASGDAGTSLGAALSAYYMNNKRDKNEIIKFNPFLGPSFSNKFIESILINKKIKYKSYNNKSNLIKFICEKIIDEKVVAIFSGRMEFGPRALGSRSIIADPRSIKMRDKLNLIIKYRESFRPFAPVILKKYYDKYFYLDNESPFMSIVAKIKQKISNKLDKNVTIFKKLKSFKSEFPAITHIDNSARIQTIEKNNDNLLYEILSKFHNLTGCPMLINTSFNINEEPIVCSPEDALNSFFSNNIDFLILNKFIITKE